MKRQNDLVYIILVNHNGGYKLIECVKSLTKINYPNFRILIVDNGSSDFSILGVRMIAEIETILNYSNHLFAKAANQGITHALSRKANWILLLNPDTIVDKNFLTDLVNTAKEHKVKIASPLIFYKNPPNKIWSGGGMIEFPRGDIFHIGLRKEDDYLRNLRVLNRKLEWTTFCCALIHSNVFKKIGLLDEQFKFYTEDTDFCHRARMAGFEILNVSTAKIWHDIPVNPKKRLNRFNLYHRIRGQFLFFKKHAVWYNWISMPFFIIGRVIKFIFRRFR